MFPRYRRLYRKAGHLRIDPESVLETQNISLLWPNLSQDEMMDLFYKGLDIREIVVDVLARKKTN